MSKTLLTEHMNPAAILRSAQRKKIETEHLDIVKRREEKKAREIQQSYEKLLLDGLVEVLEGKTNGSPSRIISKKGFNVNIQDEEGKTPLHYAAGYGNAEAIAALIKKEANLEAKDNEGRTAMHWAAVRGGADAARELLACGAKLEAKDRTKSTPLLLAALAGNADSVKALIDCGASVKEIKLEEIPKGQTYEIIAAELYTLKELEEEGIHVTHNPLNVLSEGVINKTSAGKGDAPKASQNGTRNPGVKNPLRVLLSKSNTSISDEPIGTPPPSETHRHRFQHPQTPSAPSR